MTPSPRTDPRLVLAVLVIAILFIGALLIQAYPDVLAPAPPVSP